MNRRLVPAVPVALALIAAVGLAGCGTSAAPTSSPGSSSVSTKGLASMSAFEIFARTKAAAALAKSVRVDGTVLQSGAASPLALAFGPHGTSGYVTNKGYKVNVVVLGTTVYLRAPDAFYTATLGANAAAVIPKISGKWVEGKTTNANFASFAAIADKDRFLTQTLTSSSTVAKTSEQIIAGQSCIGLTDVTGTLFVAQSDARPAQLIGTGATAKSKLDFTDYDQVPDPLAPPAAQVVDAAALGQ